MGFDTADAFAMLIERLQSAEEALTLEKQRTARVRAIVRQYSRNDNDDSPSVTLARIAMEVGA